MRPVLWCYADAMQWVLCGRYATGAMRMLCGRYATGAMRMLCDGCWIYAGASYAAGAVRVLCGCYANVPYGKAPHRPDAAGNQVPHRFPRFPQLTDAGAEYVVVRAGSAAE